MVALTLIVSAYNTSLAICRESRNLLFPIAVAEHFVFYLFSFFTSALICGPVEYIPVFEGVTAFVESGILLPLPVVAHAFVVSVGLFSVIQGTQFTLKKTHLTYHHNLEVDRDNRTSVRWFLYESASGDMVYIPAREIATGKGLSVMLQSRNGSEQYPSCSSPGIERRWRRGLRLLDPLFIPPLVF